MSRNERRAEEFRRRKELRKQNRQALHERRKAEGLNPHTATLPNGRSDLHSVEEERTDRQETTTEQLRIFRAQLPVLMKRLEKIEDPRNAKKLKYRLALVLLYGLLAFVYQMASRREANRKMTRPMFMENLRLFFPELETLPHHDTLNRLLSKIEVEEIVQAHLEMVRILIRKKKFRRYLISGCYPIAFDGTQKLVRWEGHSEQWLEREVTQGDQKRKQYYVYVLEANLVFSNGMVIPLMSEFMDYAKGDSEKDKQDCEQRGFQRLAEQLNKDFPRLPILALLDGLYANGPIMELCRRNKWQFMIVLQDKSLPSVWEEFYSLGSLQPENFKRQKWGDREQLFLWVDQIEYRWGTNQRKKQIVHVVTCQEQWEEQDRHTGEIVTKNSRHAWLSSHRLSRETVHERCNLGARHRWGIEAGLLVEKQQGYQYEHCFSVHWNAMKGYHYLMRLAHALNVLAHFSSALVGQVRKLGVRGVIDYIRETLAGPWLDPDKVRKALDRPFQLRLE